MELKDLIREKIFAEIISERDEIILQQHTAIEGLKKELEESLNLMRDLKENKGE